jgi:dephospho-CoA kinase
MIVIGLTGSIGMGKSTAAAMLRRLGLPLFDADAAVHRMLAPGGAAVARVAAAFPGVRDAAGGIDRPALGRAVFGQPEALRRLERILHPAVRAAELSFIARARARRVRLAVLDIPLLFETQADRLCDCIFVVSAPAWLQRQRVMRRPGMTESRLAAILATQLADAKKRRAADFVIDTGLNRARTLRRLRAALRIVRGGNWRRHQRGSGARDRSGYRNHRA